MASTFTSTSKDLDDILEATHDGLLQLPEFQRPWVWDDAHIVDLLASVGIGFPIGAVMLMETGGETRFKEKGVSGAPAANPAEHLILDGQQRLTSLYNSLLSQHAVPTKDSRKRPVKRWYYIDIPKAMSGVDLVDAVRSIPEDKVVRTNFGRDIAEDYTTPEAEYDAHLFPLNRVFDPFDWKSGYNAHHGYDPELVKRIDEFDKRIIQSYSRYKLPVITLLKDTPREAVCLVFEKVNTGGVALTVFELLTATFAAEKEGFNLREDWEARRARMLEGAKQQPRKSVLSGIDGPAFLQALTLLVTRQGKLADVEAGKGDDARAVGCKRRDVLRLNHADYERRGDDLIDGFIHAARFLHREHVYENRFVPYNTQLIPLAAILTVLGKSPSQLTEPEYARLKRWYWCGVFGELYGSATETRFGNDLEEVVPWLVGEAEVEPRTVAEANLSPERLDRLRTRGSAAYRGIYVLLLREGARDWITGEASNLQSYHDEAIDIHHVFPQKWCKDNGVENDRMNSIINKTPLTATTNRTIGGDAPSVYLGNIETGKDVSTEALDGSLESHFADPSAMRADDFEAFWAARRTALLDQIEQVMGKAIERDQVDEIDLVEADEVDEDDLIETEVGG